MDNLNCSEHMNAGKLARTVLMGAKEIALFGLPTALFT